MVKLMKPNPAVLTFNLIWEENPSKLSILKVLLSIKDCIEISQLYHDVEGDPRQKYVFRGLVSFSNGHYVTYLRRIACKY